MTRAIDFSLIFFTLALCGCAVNRVGEVISEYDTWSFYRVPVVYGAEQRNSVAFAEYDPVTNKGTGGCLGTADLIGGWGIESVGTRAIQYYVVMAPPGYYAGRVFGGEENPDAYFEVKSDGPQYLGDFRSSSIQYDDVKAVEALKKFGIAPDNMKRVHLTPARTDVGFILCAP